MLQVYANFAENYMALPVIKGVKRAEEKQKIKDLEAAK
jgi:hypothetical protein